MSVNAPKWVLAGFTSGPMDPHFAPGSLKITAPCLERSSCTALPTGSGHPAGASQARGGTGDVAVVPLTFRSCPSPLSPPQGHGGALGLVTGQGFGTSLRTWGTWAAYGLEPMKTGGLWGLWEVGLSGSCPGEGSLWSRH